MQPNQNIKFNDWCMKRDPPMWIAADFECINIPIIDNDNVNENDNDDVNVNDHDNKGVTDKLFVNKPVAMGYNIVKNPDYEKLNLEKDGYIKYFGEDCVEWFINEKLEVEGYMKYRFSKLNSKLIMIHFQKIMIKLILGYVKKNLRLKIKKKTQLSKTIAI